MSFKKIHFIGIGGAGMMPLAIHCKKCGYEVTGSDMRDSSFPQLSKYNIKTHLGHNLPINDIDLIVYTAAVKNDNLELTYARENNIKCIKRAELLGMLTNDVSNIVISGSHGKSTTSVMLAEIFNKVSKFNSSALIGAESIKVKSNYFEGSTSSFIVEGDEYDRSFHKLKPEALIILNIDNDHLDIYGDLNGVIESFKILCNKVKKDGFILYNGDDKNCLECLSSINKVKKYTFGFSLDNDFYIKSYDFSKGKTKAVIRYNNNNEISISYKSFGRHNLYNMLATVSMCLLKGITTEDIISLTLKYQGLKRRQEIIFENNDYLLIDDYAHHPTEIKEILKSLKESFPKKRIIALFQPHLYTRTKDQANDFAKSFFDVDKVLISHIFPARELPIDGVSSKLIYNNMSDQDKNKTKVFLNFDLLYNNLLNIIKNGDIIVSLGAGDINQLLYQLKQKLLIND